MQLSMAGPWKPQLAAVLSISSSCASCVPCLASSSRNAVTVLVCCLSILLQWIFFFVLRCYDVFFNLYLLGLVLLKLAGLIMVFIRTARIERLNDRVPQKSTTVILELDCAVAVSSIRSFDLDISKHWATYNNAKKILKYLDDHRVIHSRREQQGA